MILVVYLLKSAVSCFYVSSAHLFYLGSFHSYYAGHGSTYYQPHQHSLSVRQPQLPRCQANGCPNLVHYELNLAEDLRAFTYCSPECRDSHLLPIERANLRVELEDMKKKLQEAAASEISPKPIQRQSSYEHSSAHAGVSHSSSTSTGGKRSVCYFCWLVCHYIAQ